MSVKLGNTNIAGTQVLYSTTGSNTDGAMTQAATTTQLNLKANDSDVVHKTGNETINGTKTFNNAVSVKNINYAYNETPSSNSFTSLYIRDKNDVVMGSCEFVKNANGTDSIQFNVFGKNGSWASSALGLGITSSGATYTYAPASDVNNSIVTTVNKSKAANGYFKLGNGLIIQWGRFQNTNNNFSVTFPKSFSNTNYSVSVGQVDSQRSSDHNISINDRNTTGFTGWISCHSTTLYSFWIAIGY